MLLDCPTPDPASDDTRGNAYMFEQRAHFEEWLLRLVALNAERAAEEAPDLVRWLRPVFQDAAHPRCWCRRRMR